MSCLKDFHYRQKGVIDSTPLLVSLPNPRKLPQHHEYPNWYSGFLLHQVKDEVA
jgi:hypothetical protein